MTENWLLRAESVCMACGGHCCDEAHPPLTRDRYDALIAAGVPAACFEHEGYLRLRARPDGTCILMEDHRCTCHAVKPETCRAGPFTFDVKGDIIEIFLKSEEICPVVRLYRETPDAYDQQYALAAKSISRLVSNLTEEEIAAICRIEEPQTVKVAEIPRQYSREPARTP